METLKESQVMTDGIRQPYQWRTRCDEYVGRYHCILMLFLAYPVEPNGYVVHSKYNGKENINAEMMLFMLKLKPSRSHRTHILRIF